MSCIVITGASSGIGRAMALALPQEGERIVLAARRAEELAEVARELEGRGVTARVVPVDLRAEGSIETVRDAAAELGGARALVNNAGGAIQQHLEDISPKAWRVVVALNLEVPFLLTNALFEQLRDADNASIVNIGSAAGTFVDPGFGPYAVAKAGVHHLTRHQAVEWARYGIRANVIAPGPVRTARSRWGKPEGLALAKQITALGRPLEIEEIVGCAAFLLSPEASAITGQVIGVDGGFLGWPPMDDGNGAQAVTASQPQTEEKP